MKKTKLVVPAKSVLTAEKLPLLCNLQNILHTNWKSTKSQHYLQYTDNEDKVIPATKLSIINTDKYHQRK